MIICQKENNETICYTDKIMVSSEERCGEVEEVCRHLRSLLHQREGGEQGEELLQVSLLHPAKVKSQMTGVFKPTTESHFDVLFSLISLQAVRKLEQLSLPDPVDSRDLQPSILQPSLLHPSLLHLQPRLFEPGHLPSPNLSSTYRPPLPLASLCEAYVDSPMYERVKCR